MGIKGKERGEEVERRPIMVMAKEGPAPRSQAVARIADCTTSQQTIVIVSKW